MLHRSPLQKACAIALGALASSVLVLTATTPAHAAPCTVNHYKINTALGGTHIYVTPWANDLVRPDPKAHNAPVTGPNSRVLPQNVVNNRRAVYLANGRLGWMYKPPVVYVRCT
jgi:hypothetical protein